MSEIKTFPFNNTGVEEIKKYKYGSNWPIVYLIENGKEMYVGETFRAYSRTKAHLDNPTRQKLKNIHVVSDEESNKSATLDIESSLIEYMVADGVFTMQNGNGGMQNHDYYDRERYRSKFEVLWTELQKKKLASKDLLQIRNSDLFKYSPYKTLTDDQYFIASKILERLKEETSQIHLVHGGPGTGKTILATYIAKQLVEQGYTNIGLVISMSSLRNTLQAVFRNIPQLKSSMVISPSDATKKRYDVLIVDEAHRLRQRRNIVNYQVFDSTNKKLGLDNNGDELDWVTMSADKTILFYDERQSVRPSDISLERVKNLQVEEYKLETQIRVKGGDEYLKFVDELLEFKNTKIPNFSDYDFKLYNDLDQMVADIKSREKEHTLARMVAGYAWNWASKNNPNTPDIVIGDTKLFWNSKTTDWVNSPNAINEVGCIHTIQGYDLNYAGVIIGPELSYDRNKGKITVDRNQYFDANGHRGVSDPEELKRYIINIYKTLLTRGILGTYVYICDPTLRSYISEQLGIVTNLKSWEDEVVLSSISIEMIQVPLVGSAPCGNPLLGEENIEEYIPVPKAKLRPGVKYFIVQAEGDSMDLAGIQDGDLLLCRSAEKAETGDKVVALLGGENVTIKEYGPREDGVRLLLPRSTNSSHSPITPDEGDNVQGIVQEVLSDEDLSAKM